VAGGGTGDRERDLEFDVVVVSRLPEVDRVDLDSSLTRRVIGPAPSMCKSNTMEESE
jgi:hypothetical protein